MLLNELGTTNLTLQNSVSTMASLLQSSLLRSRVPAISFSSSLSSSSSDLQCRPSVAFSARPRRRISTVRAKVREIFMPALSSTMTEGKIVSWIKSEGDVLSKGESIVVVESDKADMDIETFYDGILAAIVVDEGETAPVGAPIGLLAESEEEIAEAKAKAAGASPQSAPSNPPPTSSPHRHLLLLQLLLRLRQLGHQVMGRGRLSRHRLQRSSRSSIKLI